MILSERLRNAVKEDLESLRIPLLRHYACANHTILSFAYNQGIIGDDLIECALEVSAINWARSDYRILTTKRQPAFAEHLAMPEYLAYGLEKGLFTSKEVEQIPFEDYGSPEDFVKEYGRADLIIHLRKVLLNPESLDLSLGDMQHPLCECELR